MYGWITPKKEYVEVPPFGHSNVGSHNEEARAVIEERLEEFDYSIYECLYNVGYIRVTTLSNKACFSGKKRHLAENLQKYKNLAERHGLIAEFEYQ